MLVVWANRCLGVYDLGMTKGIVCGLTFIKAYEIKEIFLIHNLHKHIHEQVMTLRYRDRHLRWIPTTYEKGFFCA
jgi:hypothetical protein